LKTHSIVQISSYYPPHLGGQENAVQDLAVHLAQAGHAVRVITSTAGGGARGTTIEQGVTVERLPAFVFGHAPIMPRFPAALMHATQSDSIVHLHVGQAFTPEMVGLIAKLRRFKYIAQLHIDFRPSGLAGVLLPLYKKLLLKQVLQSAAAIVVLNDQTLQVVRQTYAYRGNAYVMNNGIDDAYFALKRVPFAAQPPRTLRLLFVGRLSRQKNVSSLLHALKLTSRNVQLDLVGDGEERDSVLRIIAEQGLKTVTVHGRLPRDTIMTLYQTCDALIMPSLYEAQPLVLLEAMAARIPIIGTNVIGVADHLQGAGVITEPSSVGLADGIEQYFSRYALLPAMVQQGYRAVERLRWGHNLKAYEALYEKVARA